LVEQGLDEIFKALGNSFEMRQQDRVHRLGGHTHALQA